MKPPAKSKMSARGPQTGQRGLDWVQLKVISPSKQLSLNKFFDLSTPSMRKGDDGGEKRKEKKKKEKRKEKKETTGFFFSVQDKKC